jgi:peptide deformylase
MTCAADSLRGQPPRTDLTLRPLALRLYPDNALRTLARPLDQFGAPAEALALDMLALMRRHRGIGLAAPQIGMAVRLIVVDLGEGPVCLANPEVAPLAAREIAAEGCLSLPGVCVDVARARAVEVRGVDPTGQPRHFEACGLLARVLQHEVDHLDGILILDRAARVSDESDPEPCSATFDPAKTEHPFL